MTPPSVLIERTFIEALVDPAHEAATSVHGTYRELLAAYERHEVRLRSRHDHLRSVDRSLRTTLLAPVHVIHVAGEHRRAARRLELPFEVDDDVAVTLVVLRRERISTVATLHPAFDAIELTVLR